MKEFLSTPWKISLEFRRILCEPYSRFYCALHGIAWGKGWKIYGCPIIQRHRESSINIGAGFSCRSWTDSNPLGPYHSLILSTRAKDALLRIGEDVGITGGTLCAVHRIEIGNRVTIGANTTIVDTDFHPLRPEERLKNPHQGSHAPVFIEEDVFIGMNSIILKGVRIGKGSVIGAGSVVTTNVEPGAVYAGNPAVFVRSLANKAS